MADTKSTRTPANFKDITGQRFGRLTVVERAANFGGRNARWRCLCDCGGETVARGKNLRSGHTKSCDCLSREVSTTHGLTGHPLYMTWLNMKHRCTNPNAPKWKHYGARGIGVYPEWLANPAAFFAYVGERPEGCSLDRIDNDGNYEPDNVRWATASEQENNKRPRG